ncbi:hypothetical protein LSAT2_023778, partial [Lamellibrachia satsuma]
IVSMVRTLLQVVEYVKRHTRVFTHISRCDADRDAPSPVVVVANTVVTTVSGTHGAPLVAIHETVIQRDLRRRVCRSYQTAPGDDEQDDGQLEHTESSFNQQHTEGVCFL